MQAGQLDNGVGQKPECQYGNEADYNCAQNDIIRDKFRNILLAFISEINFVFSCYAFKIKPPKKGQMTPQPIAVPKKLNAKSLLKRALALVKVKKQMIPLIIAVAMPQFITAPLKRILFESFIYSPP